MTAGADRRAVAQLTLEELSHVALGPSRERVPALDDVLAWADGRVALNVEAKHDLPDRVALGRAIARALGRHPRVEVLLSAFDPTLLAILSALLPHTRRAWLSHDGQRRWERAWAPFAMRAPIHAVHLERTQTTPSLVSALRGAGKRVGVWTVNDPAEARDLAALGVDWLITDDVAALRLGAG
jgi:glycerophosphoryl diester phosphodiesterase